MKASATIKSKIISYPTLFGMLIGLTILITIIVIVNWFPWISDAWDKHNRLVQSVWFTTGFFLLWVNRYWRWRNRGFFWTSTCVLFTAHTVAIVYYATQVHPLVLRQWIVLLAIECFLAALGMDWLTRRVGKRGANSDDIS